MPLVIQTKYNAGGTVPTNGSLVQGELATAIGATKTYVGNASGNPVTIIGSVAKQLSSAVAITGGAITNTPITNSSVNATSLALASGTIVTALDTTTYTTSSVMGTSSTTLASSAAVKSYVDAYGTGTLVSIQTFTSSGTYTKSTGVTKIKVMLVGGGGGARCQHESGGAGGYSEQVLDATGITTVTVTVGTGSAGGGYYGNSGQGGTTSFGAYLSATGGYGANQNQTHSGGHGGVGSGGSVNTHGGGGTGHALGYNNPNNGSSGIGGTSYFGGPNNGCHAGWGFSDPGAGFGSGGGAQAGNGWNGNAGRDGKAGVVIVYEFK